MAYNYIYIDDVSDGTERGIINGIENGSLIKIIFQQPEEFETSISNIVLQIENIDGLIIDLRLNDNPNKNNYTAKYRGTTIAQELRTLAKEGTLIKDIPIILISANHKILASLDDTSRDLFDLLIDKNTLGVDDENSYAQLITKLRGFAEAYQLLNNMGNRNLESIFGNNCIEFLDKRFIDQFESIIDKPSHILSVFIIKEVLERTCFLIDNDILSSRLGVLQNANWENFKTKEIIGIKYNGIFHSLFERWWMPLLEKWWASKINANIRLRGLNASQRVKLVNDKFGTDFTSISKSEKSKSDKFWTVCKIKKTPIDTIDGFLIFGQEQSFTWQERDYVSTEEALRPSKIEIWKSVSQIEKPRLDALKEYYNTLEKR